MSAPDKLQAWWAHRQGLDGSLAGREPAEVLARSGWARSVGGAGPYLTMFARAGLSRSAVDTAVADREILELPAARGCTYVVPACDFAVALRAGQGFGTEADMRVAEKLGVTAREVDSLCKAVVAALAGGALDPEAIREMVGGAARSLGEAGRKKGLTSTLPLALGRLQTAGEIRRVPANGRLDQQRYAYVLWRPNPLKEGTPDGEDIHVQLARRYFRWTGPARLSEFQWFSGLGVKAARAATAPLGLVPLPDGDGRLMFPDDLEAYRAFTPPKAPQVAAVGSLDALVLLRRDLASVVAPDDRTRLVHGEKAAEPLGSLTDLPSHGIFDRGRLVGLWEYDTESESVVWATFGPRSRPITQAVERVEGFVREQLGDARAFSLDSPRSRAPRVEALREAASR